MTRNLDTLAYGQAQAPTPYGEAMAARESTLGETVHDIENVLDSLHSIVQNIEDHIHGTGPRPVEGSRGDPQPMPPPGLRNASQRIQNGLNSLHDRLGKIAQAL